MIRSDLRFAASRTPIHSSPRRNPTTNSVAETMIMRCIVVARVAILFAHPLAAQCANGSALPCNQSIAARRDLPLDTLKWIVLPFTNTAKVSDIDWVSTASVGLLYMDMSQWTEFHIVDDARVTDLL